MAEDSQNSDLISYLYPNFKSNVGTPPKTTAELKLINYVGTNKYDKQLTPRENIKILMRKTPHCFRKTRGAPSTRP